MVEQFLGFNLNYLVFFFLGNCFGKPEWVGWWMGGSFAPRKWASEKSWESHKRDHDKPQLYTYANVYLGYNNPKCTCY